jgi:septal ring factor EnvC (AmiA/AmiB activator)
MAEVTKKDLQSLQGYCNKQIADVHKEVAELKSQIANVKKQVESAEAAIKRSETMIDKLNVGLCDRIDAVDKNLSGMQEQLANQISDLKQIVYKLRNE